MYKILALLLALTTAGFAEIVITGTDSGGTVTFNGLYNENTGVNDPPFQIAAEAVFDVTAFSNNSTTIAITLRNLTQSPYGATVTGLGFDTNPNITGISFTDANDGNIVDALRGNSISYTNGTTVEACVTSGNSCTGGGNDPLANLEWDTFSITLTGYNSSSLTLSDFFVRVQSLSGPTGSLSPSSDIILGNDQPRDDPGVPEPSTYMMMGGGMVGLAFLRFRRK